ncbi:MAG: hypothetical protein JOZ42_07545 [Acetobacteraceae bacterium]|nr:hypothetical protein [Acetobacteraceae bacterium]
MMHDPFASMTAPLPVEAPAVPPPPWRAFLRALAEELDAQRDRNASEEMLRAIGRRMARLSPLPMVATAEAMAVEMNDALGGLGWGAVTLTLEQDQARLAILHSGLPRVGGAGNPPGQWLAPVLEGLYETWIAQQPDSDPRLMARRHPSPVPGTVALYYGRT